MIPLIISILLILFFIVVVIFSARTWRGLHITFVCLTFLMTILMLICGAMAVRTHGTWKKQYTALEKQLAEAQREGLILESGDPMQVKSAAPSLFEVQQRMERMILDRGRVWRQCTPGRPAGNTVNVATVPPNTPQDQMKPNGINPNTVLYAFRETPLDEKTRVPTAYLGEFKVSKSDDHNVALQPTMPLDATQSRLIADQSATWALYEMIPVDVHRIYSDEDTLAEPLDNTTDTPVFGKINEQALRLAFSAATGQPIDHPLVTGMIADYLKDGGPASDQDQGVHPENTWLKLEFEKAHKERVDSNNLDPGLSGNYFDPEGYAEVTRLRNGEEAKFRVNDIGLFPYGYDQDKRVVDTLIGSGICRQIGPFFVRDLRDYEDSFHDMRERFVKRQEDIQRTQRDIAALNKSIQRTAEETSYRQEERSKLQEDKEKFLVDQQKITVLVASLDSQGKTLRAELSRLHQTNLALSEELVKMDAKISAEINRRTSQVAVELQ